MTCGAPWCATCVAGNYDECSAGADCQSNYCDGGCCESNTGGGGGGGGECIDLDGECDPYNDNCCEPYGCDGSGVCTNLDPIILDLTGRGYQLTSAANGVRFDFYGKGAPIQMAWTAAGWEGGFLALDRNGNGRIDDASEMFSNITPQSATSGSVGNGFLALAVYDLPANGGNGDGWIDVKDAIYPKLLVWVDKNHNGISEPDELLSLKQAGIQAISLKYSPSKWKDAFGNTFRYHAQSRTNTSPDQVVWDVLLQTGGKSSTTTAVTKPQ